MPVKEWPFYVSEMARKAMDGRKIVCPVCTWYTVTAKRENGFLVVYHSCRCEYDAETLKQIEDDIRGILQHYNTMNYSREVRGVPIQDEVKVKESKNGW